VTKRLLVLEPEQVMGIADRVADQYGALVVLAATSGLRISELLGLDATRVDWFRCTVTVDRQRHAEPQMVDGVRTFFGEPKSHRSRRTVPVPQLTIDALAAHVAAGHDGLFIDCDGTQHQLLFPACSETVRAHLAPLHPGLTPHAFRHTYASRLLSGGFSVNLVAELLGNTEAVVMSTYGHVLKGERDRVTGAVADWFVSDDGGTEVEPGDDAAL
jgi:integrase